MENDIFFKLFNRKDSQSHEKQFSSIKKFMLKKKWLVYHNIWNFQTEKCLLEK